MKSKSILILLAAFLFGLSTPTTVLAADGIKQTYAVIINGGQELRFWEDVVYAYDMFHKDYLLPDSNIYVLNDSGLNPDGNNPDNMIDYVASKENIKNVFSNLAKIVDADDSLYVLISDHGLGYSGELQRPYSEWSHAYGFLSSRASVDPGDEKDYLESDFKLRSLFSVDEIYDGISNGHGMEIWKTQAYYDYVNYTSTYYRHKFVSHFDNVYFSQDGTISDSDIYIEEFKDYLLGDKNKDGIIDTSLGEFIDYNENGIEAYNPDTQTYDEGDWGEIDTYVDNVKYINTEVPEGYIYSYAILDIGLDNRLDIDLNHDPLHPQANGTDLDNNGLFDGLDVNDDGDKNDWVSIDEAVSLSDGKLYDDDLRDYLEPINAASVVVAMQPCSSGGFIEDLSRENTIIMTSTEEETPAFGNRFIRNFISALSGLTYPDSAGDPSKVDANLDLHKDMTEIFNFIAQNDYYGTGFEIPQYDDNGDGIPNTFPIPAGGDGVFGKTVYLDKPVSIKINNGAEFTISSSVVLNLSASSVVTKMQFSNDGVSYSSLEPYQATKLWNFYSGDGIKKVYVKFLDANGAVFKIDYDTILLDTTPPTVYAPQTVSPTENRKPVWSWGEAVDSGSGLAKKYKFYLGTTPGGNQIINGEITEANYYVCHQILPIGQYYAYVTVSDLAGNSKDSAIFSVNVVEPLPAKAITSFSVSFVDGKWKATGVVQKHPAVIVDIWASLDGGTMKYIGNQIKEDGSFYFTPSNYWQIANGTHTIKVETRFQDFIIRDNFAEAQFSTPTDNVSFKSFNVSMVDGKWKATGVVERDPNNLVTIWASLDGGAMKYIGYQIKADGSFYFTPSNYWNITNGNHTVKVEARPTWTDPDLQNNFAQAGFTKA
jgi:hypothetical protein